MTRVYLHFSPDMVTAQFPAHGLGPPGQLVLVPPHRGPVQPHAPARRPGGGVWQNLNSIKNIGFFASGDRLWTSVLISDGDNLFI